MSLDFQNDDAIRALDQQQRLDWQRGWQVANPSGGSNLVSEGTGNFEVDIASGDVNLGGTTQTASSATLDFQNDVDPDQDRLAVVYRDSSGVAQKSVGTADDREPSGADVRNAYRPPADTLHNTDGTVLAEVLLPAGASEITASEIRDRRLPASLDVQALTTEEGKIETPSSKTIDASNYGTLKAATDALPEHYAADVTLDIPNGTYSISDIDIFGLCLYGNTLTLQGDPATPSNVVIDAQSNGHGFNIEDVSGHIVFDGVRIINGSFANIRISDCTSLSLKNVESESASGDQHAGGVTVIDTRIEELSTVKLNNNSNAGLFLDFSNSWMEANREFGVEATGLEIKSNGIHGIAAEGGIFYIEGAASDGSDIVIDNNDSEGIYADDNASVALADATVGGNTKQAAKALDGATITFNSVSEGSSGANASGVETEDLYAEPGGFVRKLSSSDYSIGSAAGGSHSPSLAGEAVRIESGAANTTVSSNGSEIIPFDNAPIGDDFGDSVEDPIEHNLSNNQIVVNNAGVARITAAIQWAAETDWSSGDEAIIEILVGGTKIADLPHPMNGEDSRLGKTISVIHEFDGSGQGVKLQASTISGNAHDLENDTESTYLDVEGIK